MGIGSGTLLNKNDGKPKLAATLLLDHWGKCIPASNVSFTFNDFANPTRINVKKGGNSVLKFPRSEKFPHFYCIIKSEPAARLFNGIHNYFLSKIAIGTLDFTSER